MDSESQESSAVPQQDESLPLLQETPAADSQLALAEEPMHEGDSEQVSPAENQAFSSFYPSVDFAECPRPISRVSDCFSTAAENFLRGCKWAPDGSCLMTNSNDNVIRLFNSPACLYESKWTDNDQFVLALSIRECELIYDFTWYPLMNSSLPETCCVATTAKDHPTHLFDAFTGELRCSYRAYNHLDEMVAAHSLRFSSDGRQLFCGFNKCVRVFEVDRPGRDCQTRPTFRKRSVSLPGIVSSIAINDPMQLYAYGSYSKTIGLYSSDGELVSLLDGHQGGVTHLQFSLDGNQLVSGARMDGEVLVWDMRSTNSVLHRLQRKVDTNQRIYFDLSRDDQFLVSGNTDGMVTVWNLATGQLHLQFRAHDDCANGVSLHPFMPLLATTSGQRQFPPCSEDAEEHMFDISQIHAENALKIWPCAQHYLEPAQ